MKHTVRSLKKNLNYDFVWKKGLDQFCIRGRTEAWQKSNRVKICISRFKNGIDANINRRSGMKTSARQNAVWQIEKGTKKMYIHTKTRTIDACMIRNLQNWNITKINMIFALDSQRFLNYTILVHKIKILQK